MTKRSPPVAVANRQGRRVDARGLARLCGRVLREEGVAAGSGGLSVACVDDRTIRDLNRRFHGEDRATDVLAFPLGDGPDGPHGPRGGGVGGPALLGEVVLSVETAYREARRRSLPRGREVALYAVHGTLHLLGYDDHRPADRRRMRAREREILGDARRRP
ncbi:MAG: rRNA maturation RNase YbeY [Planctomycetales bacterium]|nr:rRNA maturation RNase YbeY [Planctomycetales bacterium]